MSTMAGQDRSVQVNLDANVTGYQKAMAAAANTTNALAVGVGKLARVTDDFIKKAGRIQIGIAGADLASLTAAAAVYNRLDESMSQIRATSAVTGQSVGALRGQIISLSHSIPDSTTNIARLMGQVQALGIQGTQNIRNFTESAERLGAATDTPPGQLLQGIVQLNREMGTGLGTVNNYSSALVELSKQNGVSAGDILGFSQSIQSIAQQAGYTETQIMGLATAFTRAGADSAAAANVFVTLTSQINQAIVSNSAQLNQFASLVGMTRDQFRSLAQSHPEQAFTRILEAIQGQGQRGILTLQQLGLDGPRALRVIASLTSGQANMAQSMNQASDAYSKNSALTKSSNAAWSDLASTMTELRNELTQLAVQFGGPMAHVLDIFFKGVTKVLGGLNSFLGLLGPIPGIVAMIGGAFLAVTGTITMFSVALLAAAGAWRAMSGMTGTNIMQGLVGGLRSPQGAGPFANPRTIFRQRQINMAGRSPSAQRIYQASYGMGQRWSAPPAQDSSLASRAMGRVGGGLRGLALFPVRKLGWEAREALDTARHPFNYEARNAEAVNPMSMLGMFQGAQRGVGRIAGAVGPTAIRQAGLNLYQRLPEALKTKVDLDTTAAQAKIDAVRANAEQRIEMRVDAGRIPTTDLRYAAGGRQIPLTDLRAVATHAPEALEETGMRFGMLSTAGRAMGGLVGGLGALAGAVGSVVMPLSLLAAVGVPLYHEFNHLVNAGRDAANNLDDLGAGLVQAAGGTYTKPSGTGLPKPPTDKVTPWSTGERNIALSGSFAAASNSTITRISDFNKAPIANRVAIAQQAINEAVANNNGQPLSQGQKQTLREQLLAAYGGDTAKARAVYNRLNFGGQTGRAAARTSGLVETGTTDDSSFLQAPYTGSRSARQLRSSAEPIVNALMSGQFGAAGTGLVGLAQAAGTSQSGRLQGQANAALNTYLRFQSMVQRGQRLTPQQATQMHEAWANYQSYSSSAIAQRTTPGVLKFQGAAQSILDQYNKGQTKTSDQVRGVDTTRIFNLQDFLDAVKKSGPAGQRMAAALASAGLKADDLSGSLKRLKDEVDKTPTAQQQRAINNTGIGRLLTRNGFNISNPQDVSYGTQMAILTQLSMLPRGQANAFQNANAAGGTQPLAAAVTNTVAIQKAIRAWTDYKNALPGPDDPAYAGAQQAIQNLNQQLQAQNAIFMQPQQLAGVALGQAQHILTAPGPGGIGGQAGVDAQNYIDQAGQQITQAEGQLMNYMTQVHNAHIQSQYEEHDHNLQMSRMWRDYNIQQHEALYQRNKQLEEANYQFNDQLRSMRFSTATAFGNPAEFVQSAFTMSAESALTGMRHQNELLRDSKNTMDRLARMGVSRQAIRLLGLDDPKNVEQAKRYLINFAENPKLIAAFNNSIKGRLSLAQGLNTDPNNSKFADMRRQFDHSARLATEAFNHSQQVTSDAFHRSLDDFATDYTTSVNRQQDELNRLGEQIFHNFGELNRAAMKSGLANIETFASGIVRQVGRVQRVQSRLIQEGIDAINNQGQNGGGGGGGGGGTANTGITAQGSQRGGGFGNAAVGGGASHYDVLANGKRILVQGSAPTNYVAPGSGSVYGGSYRANYGKGGMDYRPSADFMAKHPADPNFNKSIAKRMAPHWANNPTIWGDWLNLWNNESGWSQYADNPTSDAYGIPQALPGDKMRTAGSDWRTNPATQIAWGINYIKTHIDGDTGQPYGTPSGAWAHEQKHNWYAKGGVFGSPQTIGVGESGPEAVIPLNAMGSSFVSKVVQQAITNSGITRSLVGMTHTMPRASVVFNAPITNHSDYSTNFTGPVNVVSQNPDEMARKLEQRRRIGALTRPIARR